MNNIELVQNINGQAYTTSRMIAEKFGKQHKHVLTDIKKLESLWIGTKKVIPSTYKNRGKDYKEYLVSQEFETILNHKYIMRCARTRFEESFDIVLKQMCDVFGFKYETQVNIDDKYRVDFYFRDLNVILEYDEEHHFSKSNIEKDKEREDYLIDRLDCIILRVDYKDTDVYNASLVIKELQQIKLEKEGK